MWTRPALPSSRSTSAASESSSAQSCPARAVAREPVEREMPRVDRPDERFPFRRGRAHMRLETADRRGVAHARAPPAPRSRTGERGAHGVQDSPGPSLDSTRGRQDHRTGESEGWRRQDDDRDQPRRVPRGGGRAGVAHRPRPAGERNLRARRGGERRLELRPARRRPGRGARRPTRFANLELARPPRPRRRGGRAVAARRRTAGLAAHSRARAIATACFSTVRRPGR